MFGRSGTILQILRKYQLAYGELRSCW